MTKRVPTCHPDRKYGGNGLCHSCYVSAWTAAHPAANTGATWLKSHPVEARLHRRRATLKRLGVTPEQYDALWQQQQGKCANRLCDYTAPLIVADFRRGLQVDHDHATGAIRGLLCPRCNTALGHIKDDKARLLGLIEYLGLMI